MNERTKKLAEQAGYNTSPYCRIDREFDKFDIERFAELVRQDERELMNELLAVVRIAAGMVLHTLPNGECKCGQCEMVHAARSAIARLKEQA